MLHELQRINREKVEGGSERLYTLSGLDLISVDTIWWPSGRTTFLPLSCRWYNNRCCKDLVTIWNQMRAEAGWLPISFINFYLQTQICYVTVHKYLFCNVYDFFCISIMNEGKWKFTMHLSICLNLVDIWILNSTLIWSYCNIDTLPSFWKWIKNKLGENIISFNSSH